MKDLADRIRRGAALPCWVDVPLRTLEPLTRAGMRLRLCRSRTRVGAQVISFGNITAGGVGKTPAVIARAEKETAQGRRVAVLTRGYGAEKGPEPLIVQGGAGAAFWRKIGDEAALILQRVPGVCIVKSANRVAGARAAIENGCDTLILDDGYQHVMLERDENILLIDASNPFGNGHLLPRGILREPLAALQRATVILLTRCDQAPDVSAVEREVRQWAPETPILRTYHAPTRLWRLSDGVSQSIERLRAAPVTAVCAIGRPEAFFRTLESLGAVIACAKSYPDHGHIPAHEIAPDRMIVATEKDAVRWSNPGPHVYALGISLLEWKG